jgi:hypothetical protein
MTSRRFLSDMGLRPSQKRPPKSRAGRSICPNRIAHDTVAGDCCAAGFRPGTDRVGSKAPSSLRTACQLPPAAVPISSRHRRACQVRASHTSSPGRSNTARPAVSSRPLGRNGLAFHATPTFATPKGFGCSLDIVAWLTP